MTRFDEYLVDGDCSSSGSSGEANGTVTSAVPGLTAADVLDDLRFHQIMAAVAASNVGNGSHLQ